MKKSFKKMFGILLVSAMVFTSFTGCSSKKAADETAGNTADVTKAPETAEPEATATPSPTPTPEPTKDLGGMEITIGNWWEVDPPAPPKTTLEEDTLAYRQEIMEKNNFTIKTVNLGTWGEYQEIMVSSTMAGDPAADVFIMDSSFVAAPLSQGLLYPLNTLENLDLSQDKCNKQVIDMMTMNGNAYGTAVGRMEPRLGVFWNKRLFEEAGIDPNLPYDLQAKGEWTWEAYKDLCKKLTRDTNNDGVMDTYGNASFSVEFFKGFIFSNNAKYIGKDESGKLYNATNEANFLEALQFARSIYDEGYSMPQPVDSNWDWFIPAFKDANVAMTVTEEYKVGTWAEMADDWGFVIFPKGPQGEMMTVFNENVVVMPVSLEKEQAENIAYAYNLFTNTTPGYENEDWKTGYYPAFRDTRAVDETLPLFYEADHGSLDFMKLVSGINPGDICYDLDAGAATPAELIEKVQNSWQTFIDSANGVTK